MATVTQIVTQIRTILSALADVDYSSQENYQPAITTTKVALLIVPFDQRGSVSYANVERAGAIGAYSIIQSHRITCEFWIKVDTGDIPAAMQRGRDISLQAILLLSANPTLNGTVTKLGANLLGAGGVIGEYEVMAQGPIRNEIPYILAKVYVSVMTQEPATW